MPKEFPRARRVAEQVQRTLAEMLRRDIRDPRLRPLTVTNVRVSPDLSHAWVQYAMLGSDSHDPLQREILDDAAVYLRGPLGRALRLRVAPHLHFAPDDELERSMQLDALITRAVRDDDARHGSEHDAPATGAAERPEDGAGDAQPPDPEREA